MTTNSERLLFDLPPRITDDGIIETLSRRNDLPPSKEAARKLVESGQYGTDKEIVLRVFQAFGELGATHKEAGAWFFANSIDRTERNCFDTVRKRCSDLVNDKLIVKCGEKRDGTIWKAVMR